jgi:hypothetical protein
MRKLPVPERIQGFNRKPAGSCALFLLANPEKSSLFIILLPCALVLSRARAALRQFSSLGGTELLHPQRCGEVAQAL